MQNAGLWNPPVQDGGTNAPAHFGFAVLARNHVPDCTVVAIHADRRFCRSTFPALWPGINSGQLLAYQVWVCKTEIQTRRNTNEKRSIKGGRKGDFPGEGPKPP